MKRKAVLVVALLALLAACQADVCPPESVGHVADPSVFPTPDSTASDLVPTPEMVPIGSKMIEFDRVVHGPLCNDSWQGKVYVACDVQVAAWTEEQGPFFLDECDLSIEPGTVVYVAAHNNTAYYKGCAVCHTREGAESPSR